MSLRGLVAYVEHAGCTIHDVPRLFAVSWKRVRGFEPLTSGLGSMRSTTELHPRLQEEL